MSKNKQKDQIINIFNAYCAFKIYCNADYYLI